MDLNKEKQLHFELVNDNNRQEVKSLSLFSEQVGFIETVDECLQEANEIKAWRPVGIYDREQLVGFAMYGYFPEPAPGRLWLDRLLNDKKYQGQGYGRRSVLALLHRLYAEYGSETGTVYLSVYMDNSPAIRLYESIGFRFNGKYDSKGEHIMEYHFTEGRP